TATTLIGFARAQRAAGGIGADSALALLDRAVAAFEAAPSYAGGVSAFVSRARLRKERGDERGALADLEEALTAVDEQRARVGGDEETRAHYMESFSSLFAEMVSWKLEAGDTTGAFDYAERGRARALLDQLAAGKIDLRSSIPDEERPALERREADAQSRLAELQQRITLLRSRGDLPATERSARIGVLDDSLHTAEEAYQQVYADIKNASPLWRDEITSGGRPASLQEIQRSVVPADGMLVSYQIGERQSFVFVVPPRGGHPQAFPLTVSDSAAAVLGIGAGELTIGALRRVLGGDSTDAQAATGGLFQELSRSTRGSRVAGRRQPHDATAQLGALFRVLLPAPAWAQLRSVAEVIVIPDGPLHYLPFEALVVDPAPGAGGVSYWLDAGPAIRYAASATALANITRRPAARAVVGAGRMMLSVSDPIFDPAEVARTIAGTARPAAPDPDPDAAMDTRGTRDSYARGGGSLARLPGTARETELVRSTFGAGASTKLEELSGLAATESNLRASLDGKRFLHLATHGLVDARRGTLFASLAFTPPAGETTDHENDGFWQLHEIYEQHLSGVELAVLSACESNVGQNVEGEGVFALARGFTAAGAQRVVASQWDVDDASTAQLIGEFFRQVLAAESEGRPVRYAVALRDARRAVRRQSQWSDPYFWAAFV
ncbi:MAG: CHAT domain-containing protein, partial [Gemmatimonadota bacterium]|nr:CHAT domain-containing protein [Gemmatimonadota bacterium]